MKASVIIATYNRQDVLCQTLPCLLAQKYQHFEIIIIDQTPSTSARLSDLIQRSCGLVSYHRLSAPNLPAARNTGIGEAIGDIVIFVDDDVVVGPHFVEQHMNAYADESISGLTGLCLPPDVTEQAVEMELRFLEERHHAARPLLRGQLSSVSWLPGYHMSFRRAAVAEAGPFDQFFTLTAHCEDVDMSCRLRRLGRKLIVDTRIELIHLAIAEGGCEIRSGLENEEKERHRFVLTCYCRLKNFQLFGLSGTMAGLVRAYRSFALNRQLFRRGRLASRIAAMVGLQGIARSSYQSAQKALPRRNHMTLRALPHGVAP